MAKEASGWATLVRLGGLGDLLIASSVFPLLRAKYGRLEVIAQEPHAEILRNDPHIDKLTIKEMGGLPFHDGKAWQHWFRDRGKEVDFLINLSHSIETTLAFTEDQTPFWWPEEFRRKLCDVSYLGRTHDLACVPRHYNPRFYPTPAEVELAKVTKKAVGDVVVGWCIGGTRIDKVHPQSALIIARIIKELHVPVILFGAPGRDMEYTNQIFEHVQAVNSSRDGLFSAITRDDKLAKTEWPARRSLATIAECDLVVAPDTGLAWGVSMLGMPKVILHSHASVKNIVEGWVNTHSMIPDRVAAPCWPCNRLHTDASSCRPNPDNNGAACISSISVEAIVSTVARLLPKEAKHEPYGISDDAGTAPPLRAVHG